MHLRGCEKQRATRMVELAVMALSWSVDAATLRAMADHLRIKICGVTDPEDGYRAAMLGADAIGLNFYASSERYVDTTTAAAVLKALPPLVEAVGVFVNMTLDGMAQIAGRLGRIHTLQAHGELPEARDPSPYRLIPAFPVADAVSLRKIEAYLERCRAKGQLPAAILVDADVPGQFGGTGRHAPWELLANFQPGVPLILAGGLRPDNVADAVRMVRPYAVDVAGGVEYRPGRKDPAKLRRFIDNARDANELAGARA
jgi:phosphoribosylanthranilate isomerase